MEVAKIMGGVGGELTEARDGRLEPCKELIPGNGEVLDFVFCGRNRKALREVANAYAEGGSRYSIDGLEGAAAKEISADGRED